MLIIGAGGLVTQLLDDLKGSFQQPLYCWSETPVTSTLLQQHTLPICSDEAVAKHFEKHGNACLLAIGGPLHRKQLTNRFGNLKGSFVSFFSPQAFISKYCTIQESVVLAGARIEAEVTINRGGLINVNAFLAHGCTLGCFVEIGPGALLLGNVQIGDNTFIGAGTIILPKVKIGANVIVAAGSVITKEVPDKVMVAGNPAQIKKALS